MRFATSRHRRYSDACGGEVTVYVTPTGDTDDHGKSAVLIGVTSPKGTVWAPDEPLWLSPLYDATSARGRREAADAAVGFFEAYGCGAKPNPVLRGRYPRLPGDTATGLELIDGLHNELWAADPRAAKKLHDAYRIVRPHRPEELKAFVESFIDELNRHAPDGVYFGTPTGEVSDLGWWPSGE
jgi:hypothetical protein